MTRSKATPLVLALLALPWVACSRTVDNEPTLAKKDPAAPLDVAPPKTVDLGPVGPVSIVPPLPPFEKGMMDHADVFGWSKDGTRFGQCNTDGGMGARHCSLFPGVGAGPEEYFDDIDAKTSDIDPKKTAAIEARMKKLALSVTPAQWAFARDLEIVWEVIPGDAMSTPEKPAVLRVGARVRNEPPAWAISLKGSHSFHTTIHPETIAVSPDGKMLGAIGHAFGGEFSDQLVTAVIGTSDLAARAYESAAKAHDAKEPGVAIAFRARAAAAAAL